MDTQSNRHLIGGLGKLSNETVTIKIIRGTVVNGESVKVGQRVQCSPADARYLKAIGKAEDAPPARGRPPKTVEVAK